MGYDKWCECEMCDSIRNHSHSSPTEETRAPDWEVLYRVACSERDAYLEELNAMERNLSIRSDDNTDRKGELESDEEFWKDVRDEWIEKYETERLAADLLRSELSQANQWLSDLDEVIDLYPKVILGTITLGELRRLPPHVRQLVFDMHRRK